jgi:signal transduction histidine kinase/CheY-like chemotaxis protein
MLAIILTWQLLDNAVASQWLPVWALACCTLVLFRVVLLRYVSRNTSLKALQKRMIATAMTLALGCTIGSVLYFFKSVGLFERAMLSAIMLGLCTASHSTNFGYRPLLLSYIGPLLGTLAVLWIANIDQLLHPLMAVALGVCHLIVGQTLLMNGKYMFEVLSLTARLEEQSQHLSEALHVAERAQSEAEASSQSKTRFIAAASHDLRQPVHVLNLFGAALKNAPLDARSREIVDNMNVAVTSLSSQLNALLDISELDSGSIKPNIQSVDLSLLANNLMSEMQKLAEDKRIQLICDVPDGLFVRTDPAMLSQIIRNLCGNAIKYTYTGHVKLTGTSHQTDVVLCISDTGIGIEDADRDKVFEEFYQASNPGRDKGRGMGLGLSIVERLIRNLGHSLQLSSRVGVGTDVTITMQRCTLEQISTARTPVASEQTVVSLPAGFWVHVIDDEEAVQKSVQAFLHTAGCKVTVTGTSQSTIDFLKNNQPSALLIDLRLQDNDSGLYVVDWVSRMRPDLPVALVTGESLADGKIAQQYPDLLMVQKPLSNDALLELLDYMVVNSMEANAERAMEPMHPA